MRNCRIILELLAYDAYLYGGYLFLFRADGSVGYIRFEKLLGLCVDERAKEIRDLKLMFLPYQNLKGNSYDLMYDYPSVQLVLRRELYRISENKIWPIDSNTFERGFHRFSDFEDIPLDVSIYGGSVFMGNSNGLYKSLLNADTSYKLNPCKLDKIFDGESIHLSSRCGTVAISSAENGLFSYNLLSDVRVNNRPVYEEYSVRSDWSSCNTLLNYCKNNVFSLLINEIGMTEEKMDVPKGYRDDFLQKRYVEKFGAKDIKMDELLKRGIDLEENLTYVFSSLNSGFFITRKGEFEVRNLMEKENSFYYSSKILFSKNLAEILNNETPVSAKTFPGGCVVELYDKVILIYKDEVDVIANEPVFSVRTYMQSNSYRNLITIVYADRVEIVAVPMLPEKGRGAAMYRPLSQMPDIRRMEDIDFPF